MKKRLLFFAAFVCSSLAFGQAFVPGNLVISRYGDGVTNLPPLNTNRAVPVFIDEFDLTGNKVQSLAMPTTSSSEDDDDDSGNRILSGSIRHKEGLITLSPNGYFLTMIGYNTKPITEPDWTTYSNTTQRTIGVITPDGYIDTRTGVRANLANPRGAITHNGASVWYVGSSAATGIRHKAVGTAAKNDSIILNDAAGYNSVYIYNEQLYYTTSDGSNGPKIGKVGEGYTYRPGNVTAGTPLPGNPTSASPDQMLMLDHDTSTPEPDLLYVTDSEEGSLYKWVFEGGQWVAKGAVTVAGTTDDILGLTGDIVAGNVVLYAVTRNALLKFADEGAISTTFDAATHAPAVLAQAPAKTQFRGVAFTPGTIKEKPYVDVSSREFASLIQQKTNLIREIKSNVTYQRYPGVEETNLSYISNRGVPIALFFLKVNLNNPNVTIEAGTPYNKSTWARQTIRDMIPYKNAANGKRQVVAASNGDYYSWTGEPDGVVHKNGEIIKESPKGKFYFGIKNDGTAEVGDKRIYDATASVLKEAIGGRFYLVHYGEIMTEHLIDQSIEPRTTVGVLSPKHVVFMWVDGRRVGHSAGLSLRDMSKIYQAIGATDAANLDGGGSTTFLMRAKDGTYETRNRPSDNSERPNANALMVMMKSEILKAHARHFSATPAENSVRLSWTTDSEGDYASYTVERSKDGKTFEETGIVIAHDPEADAPVLYESFDNNPHYGRSFYRLRKTAHDGSNVYGKPVMVTLVKENGGVFVYPNPVKNQVTLTVAEEAENQHLTLRLLDSNGNTMFTQKGSLATINEKLNKRIKSLKAGIYVVKVTGEKQTYTSRFIKE
ncbi:phosphodiester glycosidase family protein [Botryobacter ruber]|uniref:phosphodiester glycosidase family protein n=1 Tax=Botryobacter ruber TaxID=2171629 RepID=UPI0013E3236F|nr:phosphodiester glycosidase family protein [Botryobacter ruber]